MARLTVRNQMLKSDICISAPSSHSLLRSQRGSGLIMVLIFSAFLLTSVTAILSYNSFTKKQSTNSAEIQNLRTFKQSLAGVITNPTAWSVTMSRNGRMGGLPTGCTQYAQSTMNVFLPNGALFYQSGQGIDKLGQPCFSGGSAAPASTACPFYFDVSWAPMLPGSTPIVAVMIDLKVGKDGAGRPYADFFVNSADIGFSVPTGSSLAQWPETVIYRRSR